MKPLSSDAKKLVEAARAEKLAPAERAQLARDLEARLADPDTWPKDQNPPQPDVSVAASGAGKAALVLKIVIGSVGVVAAAAAIWVMSEEAPAPEVFERPPEVGVPVRTATAAVQVPSPAPAPSPANEKKRAKTKKPAAKNTLEVEVGQLDAVRRALAINDGQRALALLDHYGREFPRGMLREESSGLRVIALCRVGRKADAIQLARALIEEAPRSIAASAIRTSCAAEVLVP